MRTTVESHEVRITVLEKKDDQFLKPHMSAWWAFYAIAFELSAWGSIGLLFRLGRRGISPEVTIWRIW